MRRKIAIVGSGVCAGLATYIFAKSNNVSLFYFENLIVSPIPELVPRRDFFDAIQLSKDAENEVISQAAPDITEVIYNAKNGSYQGRVSSNHDYFVYDKGRLANWFFSSSESHERITTKINSIRDVSGFDLVLDCRGSNIVRLDPDYYHKKLSSSETKCTYIIAKRPMSMVKNKMIFWNQCCEKFADTKIFFAIPVGLNNVSIGYSYSPSINITTEDVVTAADSMGVGIQTNTIMLSGVAQPYKSQSITSLLNVIPLGEARESTCPLTEYGTMKALAQMLLLNGGSAIPPIALQRSFHGITDPHMPMELLYDRF